MSKQGDLELFKEVVEKRIPFNNFLGLNIISFEKGNVEAHIPYRDEVEGNFLAGFWHGGVISGIIDAVGGIVGGSYFYPDLTLDRISTIDLRVDYLKPFKKTDVIAVGTVMRAGNKSMLTKVKMYNMDTRSELKAEGIVVLNLR